MTRAQYISMITQDYTLVKTLAKKNDYEVLQLRNNALERDLVLRSYPNEIIAYKKLKEIVCENLPIIYDVINLDDGQIILEEFINGIGLYGIKTGTGIFGAMMDVKLINDGPVTFMLEG